ncbi:MAG TPA: SDR family oxidoreductase [Myxococcota bacterium]|nr:SDR family oxidoreductase [Myxococcota bacterium]
MDQELSGKVAIVTGGASGIGRATVELFVQQGARVVVADVDAAHGEELAAGLGPSAAFKRTDVSDADQVQALVDFAVARFGGLHVMFNNAGISDKMYGSFLDHDLKAFERVMAVNLFGVLIGTQRAARHMAKHGGGSIINTTSTAGVKPGRGVMIYQASKAAVVHVSRSLALDLAEHGIRVNCIAPGHIPTGMTKYDMAQVIRMNQPLQRQGMPIDVAYAALFLAGERSAQVTGLVLPVDGGTTVGSPVRMPKEFIQPERAKAPAQ